jgi:hypothetical protein
MPEEMTCMNEEKRWRLRDRGSSRWGLLLLLMVSLASAVLHAELPAARLSTVFPAGGKIGTSFEVTVSGLDLDDVTQLLFSKPGITAKSKQLAGSDKAEPNKFVVTVAPDAPLGIYEARLVGRFGISNPRAFVVGDQPELTVSAANNSIASASDLTLGTTVNGRCEATAVDYFKFSASRGQRILVGCLAKEIDSRMDAVLALYDTAGRELERSRRGGLLDFTAPADGRYILVAHDLLYKGGDDYFYRLSVSTRPHIDFVFPPSGLAGTKEKYVLYGRNLPGSAATDLMMEGKPLEQLTVEIELPGGAPTSQPLSSSSPIKPADSVVDGVEYRLNSPQGFSNPVLIGFATAPVVLENNPNDRAALAQKISVPCEYVGQFYPRGDHDWITFDAKKGDVYWVEVFSQRLGLPTAPFALVQRVDRNEKGQENVEDVQELSGADTNIGGTEFNAATRDPAGRLEVKQDGTYRIEVRDLFNPTQDNPAFVYRLSLRKEAPDFRLVVMAPAPPPAVKDKKEAVVWTPFLRRGETMPIKVWAFRRDNFNGEIRLAIEGLPPGVLSGEAKIEANKTSAVIMLTASDEAAAWVGSIRIVGQARIGESDVKREARAGTITWTVPDLNTEAAQARLARDFVLAVSGAEKAPVRIEPAENKVWETSLAGKLQLPVKLTRHGEFAGNVKLKPTGLPQLDAMKEVDVNGKTNQAVLEFDVAQLKLSEGTYSFYLQGQAQGKYRRLMPEEVKSADAAVKTAEEASQKIEKEAAELSKAATSAKEALDVATKAAREADALAKTTAEKLASAKAAAEKTPGQEALAAAKTAAEKEAADAAAKLKTATDSKVTAEKTAAETSAKAKAIESAKETAQRQVKEAKDTVQKGQPKDVAFTTYSIPVMLKIASAPVTLASEMTAVQLEPGKKVEIPVSIKRLYGFSDSVEVSLILPKEANGVSAAKVTIPKDQTDAKLIVDAAPNAPAGKHQLTLRASLKFNGRDLKVEQMVELKIAAAEKAKL